MAAIEIIRVVPAAPVVRAVSATRPALEALARQARFTIQDQAMTRSAASRTIRFNLGL